MTVIANIVGDGTTTLAVDDDPNTTAPDTGRIFTTVSGTGKLHFFAIAQGPNPAGTDYAELKIWIRDPSFDGWYMSFDDFAIGGWALDENSAPYTLPRNVDCFVQVVFNSGVTKLGIGYMHDTV